MRREGTIYRLCYTVPGVWAAYDGLKAAGDAGSVNLALIREGGIEARPLERPIRPNETGSLHPRHLHDLDDLYPCAGHLQVRLVLAENLCRRIGRFGLYN
jgi:hypothetical protein